MASDSATVERAARWGVPAVLAAVLVFAAANSVVRLLYDLGAANPVEGRNAISFCNVLFVGNLCALITLLLVYHREWRRERLAQLSRRDWLALLVVGPLSSALAPALIFLGLENTSVTNVVLVGRIEPPLLMLLAALVLRERPNRWAIAGAVVSFLGVVLVLYLQAEMTPFQVGKGEIYAALGAAVLALSTVISKTSLRSVPIGVFTVFRTGLGTIVFFGVTIYLFGAEHFMDAFTPIVWQWMLGYGAVIVVGGQLLWFFGIRHSRGPDVAVATSLSPVAGVLFAFLLLGEEPGMPVLLGGAVIMAGIAIAQAGNMGRWLGALRRRTVGLALELEGRISFKGV